MELKDIKNPVGGMFHDGESSSMRVALLVDIASFTPPEKTALQHLLLREGGPHTEVRQGISHPITGQRDTMTLIAKQGHAGLLAIGRVMESLPQGHFEQCDNVREASWRNTKFPDQTYPSATATRPRPSRLPEP